MMRRVMQVLVFAAMVVCLCAPVLAQGDRAVSEGARIDKKAMEAAVKKACDWLKSQQKPDGSWTGSGRHDTMYPYSSTAFVLYALIKGTGETDSECIKKGFAHLKPKDFPGVYGVSALILALCALYEPPPEPESPARPLKKGEKLRTGLFEPVERRVRKKFRKKAKPWLKDWLKKAVSWLLDKQAANVWRYPGNRLGDYCQYPAIGGEEDASNAQYAMLALHAASRLGVTAPATVYAKVAEYFLREQEKTGPDVKPAFPVPAADLSIKRLREMEKQILRKLRKEAEEAARKGEPVMGAKDISTRTTVEMGDPYREFGAEVTPMKARGWAYFPAGTESPVAWSKKTTGSMTTSGVASLVICKARLEGTKWYKKRHKKIRQAIRDGMGWLCHHFTVEKNPGPLDCWHFYYLYGLERCGVLTLTRRIGEHFWYEEGGKYILGAQQGDGSWSGASGGGGENVSAFEYGPIYPTCFAILFLKKATAPIVNLPEDIYTGEGLFGPGKEKK